MFNKKEKDGSEQRDRVVSYKKTFGTEDGRIVLFDLMDKFHILNSHGGDPFKEGQRSVVVGILSQSNINLEQFDKLLKGEVE